MHETSRQVDIARGWPYFAVLFVITFLAFWPSYFSPGLSASSLYAHLHAFTAAIWMAMLIIQPWLIRTYRFEFHRRLGLVSYGLVPVVVLCMLLLANYRLRTVSETDYPIQTYVLYLQISLAALFLISFALAMVYRRKAEVHARFMICTGLTLVDPVFARLFYWMHPASAQYHQWFTYGLTDILFVLLIIAERRNRSARWVFPLMLIVFVIAQAPALLWLTNLQIWQSFAIWFRSVPWT